MKKHLIVFFLSSIFSCREKIIVKPIPFEGEKLVVISYLQPDKVFRVNVSKTDVPNFYKDQELGISGAKVIVYEGDQLLEVLTENEKGIYLSSTNKKPVIGQAYRIEVQKTGFETALSTLVTIPADNIKTFNVKLEKNQSPAYSSLGEHLLCTVKIDQKENKKNNYIIGYQAIFTSKKGYLSWWGLTTNPNEYSLKCYKKSSLPAENLNSQGFSFTNACFENGKILEIKNSLEIEAKSALPYIRAKKIFVNVATVSDEYMKFVENQNQPDDIERIFMDPKTTYTNIKNGYGVVAGLNVKELEFSL